MRSCAAVSLLLVLASADPAVQAQGPRTSAAVEVKPGAAHTYTFQARAGDLVIGPFNVRQGTLKLEFYDPAQKKIKASWLSEGTNTKVGFVAPTGGRYRVALTAQGQAPASFTWQTTVTSPTERMAGQRRVEPILSYQSARGANLSNQAFLDAIARELVPWLRSTHSISVDPKDLVIGGYSAGAVAGARTALAHPDVFGNVLAQSGGAAAGDRYIAAPRASVRFYIDMGLYELTPPGDLPFDEMILAEGMTAANRRFRDILLAKGYDVTYRETGGDHSFMHWRATLAEGLMTLLAPTTGEKAPR